MASSSSTIHPPKEFKTHFAPLDPSGENYFQWITNIELYLRAEHVWQFVDPDDTDILPVDNDSKSKATFILRSHIKESLLNQYQDITDARRLFATIRRRFNAMISYMKDTIQNEWDQLRFMDFPDVQSYTNEIHRITSMMRMIGYRELVTDARMIQKTITTLPMENVHLAETLTMLGPTTYEQLERLLQKAMKNKTIMLKNAAIRPPGTQIPQSNIDLKVAPPTAMNTVINKSENSIPNRYQNQQRKYYNNKKKNFHNNKFKRPNYQQNRHYNHNKNNSNDQRVCYKCGMKGHLQNQCRTSKHFQDLYKRSKELEEQQNQTSVGFNVFGNHIKTNNMEKSNTHKFIIDSATSHTIITQREYFTNVIETPISVSTILSKIQAHQSGVVGYGTARIPTGKNNITLNIKNAIYAPNGDGNLIATKDLVKMGYQFICAETAGILIRPNDLTPMATFPMDHNGFYHFYHQPENLITTNHTQFNSKTIAESNL